jgi:hypothetical protein
MNGPTNHGGEERCQRKSHGNRIGQDRTGQDRTTTINQSINRPINQSINQSNNVMVCLLVGFGEIGPSVGMSVYTSGLALS